MSAVPDFEPDLDLARRLLPEVSRTFAPSIELLPDGLRDAVRTGYLLCRIVDTIEDEPGLPYAARSALFDAFDRALADDTTSVARLEHLSDLLVQAPGAEQELAVNAGAVFRLFRGLSDAQRAAIQPHVLELSAGMREYALREAHEGRLTLLDVHDLERYCYYVAGTVGHLLTELFLLHVPDASPAVAARVRTHAIGFGVGLQLVNIVKDIAEDAERGVCFVPEALLADAGLTVGRLLDPLSRPAALVVVRSLCARARTHLTRAVHYTRAWPADTAVDVRTFCLVPLALALATLTEVERGADTLVPGRSPKVPRSLVGEVLVTAPAAAADDNALDALLARVAGWVPERRR